MLYKYIVNWHNEQKDSDGKSATKNRKEHKYCTIEKHK